jgi:predicted nucleotidyltransferase
MSHLHQVLGQRVDQWRADVLLPIRDRILAADGRAVRRLILFGSRARGDAGPDSDYDILVLVSGLDAAERSAFRTTLYRALEGIGVTVEPWVMTEEEFEESKTVIGGLAYPAWKEGIVFHPNA